METHVHIYSLLSGGFLLVLLSCRRAHERGDSIQVVGVNDIIGQLRTMRLAVRIYFRGRAE